MLMMQSGDPVSVDYMDESEYPCISVFEKACLDIKNKKSKTLSMVELGSDHAYYSMLFQSIVGKERAKNIMVEPTDLHMERGKKHFFHNNMDGIFDNRCIGNHWIDDRWHHGKISTNIDAIMSDYEIQELDILHSDIDGNETVLIDTQLSAFSEKKINYIFLLTHSNKKHIYCKNKFIDWGYNLIFEETNSVIGHDSLLIFKK